MRSGSGCSTPVSLLAVMTATLVTRDDSVRASASGSTMPWCVDGELAGIEAGFGRGPGRFAYGRVLHGRIQEHRLTPVLPGRLGGPQHGQVGRLGAARREDDLARIAAEEGGHLVAGLLEQAPCPLGRRVAPGRVAERTGAGAASSTSAMAAATSGRSGVVAAWSR